MYQVPGVLPGKSVQSRSNKPVYVVPKTYKPKSRSFPVLKGNPNNWAFVLQVTKETEAINWKSGPPSNLSPNLKVALNSIRNNDDMIVKPSNKGGNIVIMDRLGYEKMCYDILQNRDWYRPVPAFSFSQSTRKYHQILNRHIDWAPLMTIHFNS